MASTKLPLVGVSDSGRYEGINAHRAINLMPQASQTGAKENFYWIGTPGLEHKRQIASTAAWVDHWDQEGGLIYIATDTTLNLYDRGNVSIIDFNVTGIVKALATSEDQLAFIRFSGGSTDLQVYTQDIGTQVAQVDQFAKEFTITAIADDGDGTWTITTADTLTGEISEGDIVLIKNATNSSGDPVFLDQYSVEVGSITANTFGIVSVSGAAVTNPVNNFAYILSGDTFEPEDITYMDGYFIALYNNDFYVSYALDARIFLPTNNGGAQRDPDTLKSVYAHGGTLWLFGSKTTEAYYNSGDGPQPFVPSKPVALEMGLIDKASIAQLGNSLMFVGVGRKGQPSVYIQDGFEFRSVATHALEYELISEDIAIQSAFSYEQEGGYYYQLTFKQGDNDPITWCFDKRTSATTGIPCWHERQNSSGGRHYAQYCAYDDTTGKHVVSHYNEPALMNLTLDVQTESYYDNGTAQVVTEKVDRTGYSGIIHMDDQGITHHSVYLDITRIASGDGTVYLSWSDDGGNTYSSELSETFDSTTTRIEWFGLGWARVSRIYKIRFEDVDTPTNVLAAYARVTPSLW